MELVWSLQNLVLFVLWLGASAVVVVALADALRRPAPHFPAVGRLTKPAWVGILAVAAAFLFLAFPFGIMSFVGIVAAVAGIVYVVDTRVKLRELGGRGGSTSGPYGGW
jgi:cobalamin synthase